MKKPKPYKLNPKPKVKFSPKYFNKNLKKMRKNMLNGSGLVSGK